MYYSAGTYEAFARPEKPEGADRKSAYIIGTGLAGLSAAFYLVRDGQVKGEHIHLLEKLDLACAAIFFHKSHDSPVPFLIRLKSGAVF